MDCFDNNSAAYGLEFSAENTALLTNNTHGISTEVNNQRTELETVTNFKYLGSVITNLFVSLLNV